MIRRLLTLALFLALGWLALAEPASAQTTIFTQTLGSANTGNAGYSFRQELPTTGASLGQVRVTFNSPAAGAWATNHVSICAANTAPNCAAAPVELLFSGVSGFSIGSSSSITSDYATFVSASQDLVIIMDMAGAPADVALAGSLGAGYNCYTKAATASYNSQSVSGFTAGSGNDCGISLIVTQSSGSTPHSRALLGVGQ